jgi:hypothetical protein
MKRGLRDYDLKTRSRDSSIETGSRGPRTSARFPFRLRASARHLLKAPRFEGSVRIRRLSGPDTIPSVMSPSYCDLVEGLQEYREDYDAMSLEEAQSQLSRLLSDRNRHPECLIHQAWSALWRSFDVYTDNMSELTAKRRPCR